MNINLTLIGQSVAMLVFVWFTYESFGLISIPMAACVGQAISMAIITIAVIRDILEQQKLRPSLTTGGTE